MQSPHSFQRVGAIHFCCEIIEREHWCPKISARIIDWSRDPEHRVAKLSVAFLEACANRHALYPAQELPVDLFLILIVGLQGRQAKERDHICFNRQAFRKRGNNQIGNVIRVNDFGEEEPVNTVHASFYCSALNWLAQVKLYLIAVVASDEVNIDLSTETVDLMSTARECFPASSNARNPCNEEEKFCGEFVLAHEASGSWNQADGRSIVGFAAV